METRVKQVPRVPIKGFEGRYDIDAEGRVYSHFTGNYLKHYVTRKGYFRVCLSDYGKVKSYLVHRLVANAFIDNPNNLPIINHKDENKQNNRVENLEWCTNAYNTTYGTALQRKSEALRQFYETHSGPWLGKESPRKIKVEAERITTGETWIFDSLTEASKETGVGISHVSQVCNGKRKQDSGYVFRIKQFEDRPDRREK